MRKAKPGPVNIIHYEHHKSEHTAYQLLFYLTASISGRQKHGQQKTSYLPKTRAIITHPQHGLHWAFSSLHVRQIHTLRTLACIERRSYCLPDQVLATTSAPLLLTEPL